MPTGFSHSLLGVAAGKIFGSERFKKTKIRFWILSFICPSLPDLDVIGYYLGIPYAHVMGHRGITHSLFFALIMAILITIIFFRSEKFSSKNNLLIATYFTLIIASHGLLDGLTNGGHGIAYFAPFINDRYFFSFNPLQVAVLNPKIFFTEQGFDVMKNEFMWLWLPTIIILIINAIAHRANKKFNEIKNRNEKL